MDNFDQLQRAALDFHSVLITQKALAHCHSLPRDTSQQVAAKFAQLSEELLADSPEALCLELGLSSTLTTESHRDFLTSLSQFLRCQVTNLRLSDVRTEVLASWLGLSDSSGSSSVTAGGESAGELPTSSRIRIVAQGVTRVDGDAGEMAFECDHFRVVES